jgi:hypothetical protein
MAAGICTNGGNFIFHFPFEIFHLLLVERLLLQ